MIPIPKPNKEIVKEHCDKVIDYIGNHTTDGKKALQILEFAINNVQQGLTFKKLLKMNPKELSRLIPKYDNYKKTILPALLKKELTENDCDDYEDQNKDIIFYNSLISFCKMEYYYTEYEKLNGKDLMEKTSVNVCPYCNRKEIFNAYQHKTSQFDHFIPKGVTNKYPIFALCYFNLIPACSDCNHIKNSKDIFLISPYDKMLRNDTFFFDCQIKNNIDEISVKIKTKKKNIKYINASIGLNNDLELETLYSKSKIVKDKFFKIKNDVNDIQNDNYLDILKQAYKIKTKNNKISFTKFVLENYETDSDFLNYPYSKVTKDIAEKFHLFDIIKNI